MTINEKAVANLESKDVIAKIENDTVYVCIDWVELQLSEFEINYQAKEWDNSKLDEEEEN